jgi:hypothetical protein
MLPRLQSGGPTAVTAPATTMPPHSVIEPIEDIRASFVDKFQKKRIEDGEKPAERAVFRKQHGVAKGKLAVADICPPKFRVGLWAGGPYDVWMRWSSDAPPDAPDQKNNTLGFALKLFGVKGSTLATDNPLASTADLIFQNSDIFFVDNAREMAAISSPEERKAFTEVHLRSQRILKEMEKEERSLVAVHYSSTLPYALGETIVKYRLVAARPVQTDAPGPSPNYLAEDLKKRLNAGAVSFLMEAQPFVDDSVTPIDRATERREGAISPLVTVGAARSFQRGVRPLTFANNPGWHDDVCDGPVRAQVTFPGHAPIDAESGYVCVTPPNYAPGLFGLVTMDDVVREVFYDKGWISRPAKTSFTDDVLPLFQRLTGLQWVNHGLFIVHGFGSLLDAQNAQVITKLNDGSPANAAWRKTILAMFRDPGAGGTLIEEQIPQIFGDAVDAFSATPPEPANGLLAVTKTQYAHLKRWADGTFDADWSPAAPAQPSSFSVLAPEAQIKHLERAPLYDCLGGPFHPAMEMTWVMRIPLLWKSAYRLNVLAGERPAKQDFGDTLTPVVCTGAHGPYDGAAAGCLTRFLGVPWQTDHTSCNSAADYFPSTFLSMPTFWGPRAPDQVLAIGNYLRAAAIAHLGQPAQQQTFKHLMHRVDWLRDIRGFDYYDRLSKMVTEWSELGMVLPVKAPPASLPAQDLRVEQGRSDKGVRIDVTTDWKFHAVENIESLFSPQTTMGLLQRRVARTTAPPPKRSYRQGEI